MVNSNVNFKNLEHLLKAMPLAFQTYLIYSITFNLFSMNILTSVWMKFKLQLLLTGRCRPAHFLKRISGVKTVSTPRSTVRLLRANAVPGPQAFPGELKNLGYRAPQVD